MLLLLRPKPSCSWLFPRLRIDRNPFPLAHFFSTETEPISCIEGRGVNRNSVELTGALLKRYGFSDAQICKVRTLYPQIFNFINPEKTLMPKLEFFRGTVGFSNTDLPRFICSNPSLLGYSLQKQIVPRYSYLKGLLLSDDVDEDKIVLNTLKNHTRILGYSLEKRIAPNLSALREAGVPQKQILFLMRRAPEVLLTLCVGERIKRAIEMGFNPNNLSFVEAIRVFTQMSKSTWDKKMEVYRKCGMSDDQILKAFSLHPLCMGLAEENIAKTMDFIVNKMGWQPVDVSRFPNVIGCSLEKRTTPDVGLSDICRVRGC